MKLMVAGGGPMSESLKMKYGSSANVEFLGMIHGDAVGELLAGARFSILPSEWYENNPMGVIESLCAGTPVLGAAIGGIPELIDDESGMTFESGDKQSLQDAVRAMWDKDFDRTAIQSRSIVAFSPDAYYSRLMDVYGRV